MASKKTAYRRQFEKFKAKSDELLKDFKGMRTRLGRLVKEASKLADKFNYCDGEPDFHILSLLTDYSTFIGESMEDIYATLSNMKNSTYTKACPHDKRKKVCYERTIPDERDY